MASLSISKAWDESVAFINREVRLIFPLALAFFMMPSVLMGWAQPAGPSEGGLGLLTSLAILILLVTGQVAVARLSVGWDGSVGGAIGHAFGRVWSFVAASIVVYLPLILVGLIVSSMILGANGITDPSQMTPQALAQLPSLSLAIFVFMLVALALPARLLPMPAVTAAEKLAPLALLRRSFALTRGHFWKLLGLLLLVLVVSLLLNGAASAVGGSLSALAIGPLEPFSLSALVAATIRGFFAAAATAITSILTGRLYVQLATQPHVPDVREKA